MKVNKKNINIKKNYIKDQSDRGFGLVELMIVIAILAFIVDVSMPRVQSYLSHKKEDKENSAVLEVAVYNVKTYVTQIDQNLAFHNKNDGSYYISDIQVSLSGTLPTDDSWVVINSNKITQGMFKEPCGSGYAYVSYDGENFTILDATELTEKP